MPKRNTLSEPIHVSLQVACDNTLTAAVGVSACENTCIHYKLIKQVCAFRDWKNVLHHGLWWFRTGLDISQAGQNHMKSNNIFNIYPLSFQDMYIKRYKPLIETPGSQKPLPHILCTQVMPRNFSINLAKFGVGSSSGSALCRKPVVWIDFMLIFWPISWLLMAIHFMIVCARCSLSKPSRTEPFM